MSWLALFHIFIHSVNFFRQTRKDWTCEDCHNGVDAFGFFYADETVAGYIIEGLQGEDFCANPDNAFPEDQIQQCAENIKMFMPPALSLIGDTVVLYDNEICNEWYDGICKAKKAPFF